MKGAVLHRLGMNFVTERRMRAAYGIGLHTSFDPKIHPDHLKGLNKAGRSICTKGLKWCVYKVLLTLIHANVEGQRMANGHLVKLPGKYSRQLSEEEYQDEKDRKVSIPMMICNEDEVPAYESNSGFPAVTLN